MTSPAPSTPASSLPGVSLLDTPFATLGASARMGLDDLTARAEALGTADARTALRTLSVPRTRLEAEAAFLPGAAEAGPAILAALARGERPDPSPLPDAARVNLLAHLCAAGLATDADAAALVSLQVAPDDAGVLGAIAADRTAAGFPSPQPQPLAAVRDALADRHAAALVAWCGGGADPAERLAALVRSAPDGAPQAFARRAAATWARQSAAALDTLQEAADTARTALLGAPTAAEVDRLVAGIRAWAALTAPQRAADSRLGLDHEPSLRLAKQWRRAGLTLAEDGRPEISLPLATALAEAFADLPGYAGQLREDARDCAALIEERALGQRLAPLRALVERFGTSAGGLAGSLAKHGFGPRAAGDAGALWAAFDAACTACAPSEAPWAVLRGLAVQLHNTHNAVPAALALLAGAAARAKAAGLSGLAARLDGDGRALRRTAGLQRLRTLLDGKKTWAAMAELRRVLPLVDDADTRAGLLDTARGLRRRIAGTVALLATVLAVVGLGTAAAVLDSHYSATAPYRAAAAPDRPLRPPVAPPAPPAPPVPVPGKPAAGAGAPKLGFPSRTALPERAPARPDVPRSQPEQRWCQFNAVRLRAALDAASPDLQGGVRALMEEQARLCGVPARRGRDADQVAAELGQWRGRLEAEGRAMLTGQDMP